MERIHIAFFGPTNSGKSTLVNAIAGQQVSLVSAVPGTTTDPVRKAIELPGLGPCVLIDTAGFDDTGVLGPERLRLTLAVLDEADVAVEVLPMSQNPGHWKQNSPENAPNVPDFGTLASQAGIPLLRFARGESVESLLQRIKDALPQEEERFLTGDLVKEGDTVLLVMPQDSEAPKGRLILPQVQVLRELLDRGCIPHCCTPASLPAALTTLKELPALTITDSQVFGLVNQTLPAEATLTSFSVLLAAAKGDIAVFVEGARAIDRLKPGDRILIAEACTHVPDTEDIGRVKIPALLRKRVEMPDQVGHDDVDQVGHDERAHSAAAGGFLDCEHFSASETKNQRSGASVDLHIDIAAGNDFPEDLSGYNLIIHCGACVAGRQVVRSRIRKALRSGVPITNYGIALAKLQGILDRIAIPGLQTRRQSS
ncbi:MAG: 50S ribosome-binding GTPase [Bacteroidales bacterium]|nr:50S ribosome-binding GTPase [Bacteroidales bacterium]